MSDELTAVFDINVIGENSGNPYTGSFKARTLLTMRQLAVADEVRRDILGTNPEGAAPLIQQDAFAAGQLSVRLIDAPEWFTNAGLGGIDLADRNVLMTIFEKAYQAEQDRRASILKASKAAAKELKEKTKK